MIIQTDKSNTIALQIIGLFIGLLFMYLARGFEITNANLFSAFLLGILIAGLSAVSLVIGESRVINIDARYKHIVIDVRRRIKAEKLTIKFSDIDHFGIGCIGSRTDGSEFYDVCVHLKSGKEIYFFGGCAYQGRMNKSNIKQLIEDIECLVFD